MSKVLVDDTILSRAIKAMWLGFDSLSRSGSVFTNDLDLAIHGLEKAIEESKEKRSSVLEWHDATEKPEMGRTILVRHLDKNYPFDVYKVSAFILDGFGDHHYHNVREWAYLPED